MAKRGDFFVILHIVMWLIAAFMSLYLLSISVFLVLADYVYFYALSMDGAMVSIVSMVRRSNVIVSFIGGVLILHETKNWKRKAFDLALIFIGMIFIWLGTNM